MKRIRGASELRQQIEPGPVVAVGFGGLPFLNQSTKPL